MAKKFEINEAGAGALLESVGEKAGKTRQGTATPEGKAAREAEGRTQGRKGCKAPRINLALTADNWKFINKFKGGQPATRLINNIIETYRKEHAAELAKEAREFADELEKEAKKEARK